MAKKKIRGRKSGQAMAGPAGPQTIYGPAKVWQKHDLDDDRTTTAIHAARHC